MNIQANCKNQTAIAAQRIIPRSVFLAVLNRCDSIRDFILEMLPANPQRSAMRGKSRHLVVER